MKDNQEVYHGENTKLSYDVLMEAFERESLIPVSSRNISLTRLSDRLRRRLSSLYPCKQ